MDEHFLFITTAQVAALCREPVGDDGVAFLAAYERINAFYPSAPNTSWIFF